jgi:hypothetical protein
LKENSNDESKPQAIATIAASIALPVALQAQQTDRDAAIKELGAVDRLDATFAASLREQLAPNEAGPEPV